MQFLSNVRHPSIDVVRTAWEQYVDAGRQPGSHVRSYVARGWERSREAGCNAHMARADVLPQQEVSALLREQHRLLSVASPFLTALSSPS